jgi:hypothetical protein
MIRTVAIAFLLGLMPIMVGATIPATYTNENIWTATHDVPVSFVQDPVGNFSGYTQTGKYFSQTIITNALAIPLMRFSIDQAFFYVSDKGVIIATNDTQALSVYLARPS